MRLESRRGMTLVELIVALVLSALVLGGARSLLATVSDAGTRMRRWSLARDDEALGLALFRRGLRTAVSREGAGGAFLGDASAMSFSARCSTGGGWDRPCRIDVRIVERRDTATLIITEQGRSDRSGPFALGGLEFRYIRVGPQGEEWLSAWTQAITRPAAVALLSRRDTTVLQVAVR